MGCHFSPHRCDKVLDELRKNQCDVQIDEAPGMAIAQDSPLILIRRAGVSVVLCSPLNENVSWEELRSVCETLGIPVSTFNIPEAIIERGPPISGMRN